MCPIRKLILNNHCFTLRCSDLPLHWHWYTSVYLAYCYSFQIRVVCQIFTIWSCAETLLIIYYITIIPQNCLLMVIIRSTWGHQFDCHIILSYYTLVKLCSTFHTVNKTLCQSTGIMCVSDESMQGKCASLLSPELVQIHCICIWGWESVKLMACRDPDRLMLSCWCCHGLDAGRVSDLWGVVGCPEWDLG